MPVTRTNCPTVDFFSTTVVLLFKKKESGLEWCWVKTWMARYVAEYNIFVLEFVVNISFLNKIIWHLHSEVNLYFYSRAANDFMIYDFEKIDFKKKGPFLSKLVS